MRRVILFGFVVAVPSWVALALLAGNVGLQRSVASGAWTLLVERPEAGLGSVAVALGIAWLAAPMLGTRGPLQGVLAVLGWNLVAGLVLAPLAIGELEPIHAPIVIAATTVCGLTLLAAWAGTKLRLRSRRPGDASERPG